MPCEQAAVNTRKISDLISLIQEYNRKAHSGANVCEDTMKLLCDQHVDSEMISGFDGDDWASLQLTIGQKKILKKWGEWYDEMAYRHNSYLYMVQPVQKKIPSRITMLRITYGSTLCHSWTAEGS
jgi:hypothetical protein